MAAMKRSLLHALGFAFPLQVVNFVTMPPIDVGIPDNAGWLLKVVFYRWVVLHWVGFEISKLFSDGPWTWFLIFFGGYLEVALLFFLVFLFVERIRRPHIQATP
jgi:hypothetical protein